MAEIGPFRGYRYTLGEMDRLLSPPYDVISRDRQRELLAASPYNVVRTILGEDPEVAESERDFQGMADTLAAWCDQGILRQDDREALYVHAQDFRFEGTRIRRTGFISAVRLESFGEGRIYPHEKVMPKHVEDRYRLMETARANLGLIFGIYADESRSVDGVLERVMEREALFTADLDDVRHALWLLDDPEEVRTVVEAMRDQRIYIADGHHRYTTALRFRDAHPEMEEAKHVMMCLVNMYNEGLVIFPVHRLVREASIGAPEALRRIRERFDCEEIPGDALSGAVDGQRHTFGLWADGAFYRLRLRDPKDLEAIRTPSQALRRMDVMVLHELILKPILGIDTEDPEIQKKILFVKGTRAALDELATGAYPYGFFLNAVSVDDMIRVSHEHAIMPQKATFFYPKVYSGLVVRRLE